MGGQNEILAIPMNPRVLVVGGGAREHAILWKLAQSDLQPRLYSAPGNPGMAELSTTVDIPVGDVDALVAFAVKAEIDLVVVGPELPLSLGLVDKCSQAGIRAFGPAQAAAQLETSKAFAKSVMRSAGVPTAHYEVFTDAVQAKRYIAEHGAPIVIKADGLAAGKGVVVAETVAAAEAAVDAILLDKQFGTAGNQVVLESFLKGQEVSLMFFVDQSSAIPMVSARDHKRVFDHDRGPNTGGMGAFAPVPGFAESGAADVVLRTIVQPTLAELKRQGIAYQGVLYVGLMMTEEGPSVVEFNARFGDPETEVVLPLLKSDLLQVLWVVADNRLSEMTVEWADASAVCVVLAAPGYPEKPILGGSIEIANTRLQQAGGTVFHAGTTRRGEQLTTSGGRVLTVTGVGNSLESARSIAYTSADAIYFEGRHLRRDIAQSV